MKNTKDVTIEEVADKLNEMIEKHNDLAEAVKNLCDAIEDMGGVILSGGDPPKKYDA